MARNFVAASTEDIQFPVISATAGTHTGLCKFRKPTGVRGDLMTVGEFGVNGPFESVLSAMDDNKVRVLIQTLVPSTQTVIIATSATYSADTWHTAGVRRDGNDVTAHLDLAKSAIGNPAGSFGTNSNIDSFRFGQLGGFGSWMNGDIAEGAFWNVALTDVEIAAYHAGMSPLRIRPGNLAFYAPLYGVVAGEEPDLSGNGNNSIGQEVQFPSISEGHAPVSPYISRKIFTPPSSLVLSPYLPPVDPDIDFAMEFLIE